MSAGSPYLDALSAAMQNTFPEPNPLWEVSRNNTLGPEWLLATPTAVWGTSYGTFAQPVAGTFPDFGLSECATPSAPGTPGPYRCTNVTSTVNKVGATPVDLEAGHSSAIYEAIYNTIVRAEKLVDVTTLTPPTYAFLAAFRNAITFLSTKPEAKRPVVRILYGRPQPGGLGAAQDMLEAITRDVDDTARLDLYLACVANDYESWNHSKIVAVDGQFAVTGGHNMWGDQYLGTNPVFDVSMQVEGAAAVAAHDYVDYLWNAVPVLSETPRRPRPAGAPPDFSWPWVPDSRSPSSYYRAARRLDASSGKAVITDDLPDPGMYAGLKASFAHPATAGTATVMGVGRRSKCPAEVLELRFPNNAARRGFKQTSQTQRSSGLLDKTTQTDPVVAARALPSISPENHYNLPSNSNPTIRYALFAPVGAVAAPGLRRAVRRRASTSTWCRFQSSAPSLIT